MKTKNYIQLTSALTAIFILNSAYATGTIYDNNTSALNINMLTDKFLEYTHNGENLSDLFKDKKLYGAMTRIDEYGDDGTTLKQDCIDTKDSDNFIKNIWADFGYINDRVHYDNHISKRNRFGIATIGANTKPMGITYGNIYFGVFGGYINSDFAHIDSYGNFGGIFAHYNFHSFDATLMTNIGSLNNNSGNIYFNNSWINVAFDTSLHFYLTKTFLIRPGAYVSYTYVNSDDLYINDNLVWSDNFNFLNIAPSLQFIKKIVPDWYVSLTAKYVTHFDSANNIHIGNFKYKDLDIDDYTDIGLKIEYDISQFVLDGQIHKQIGGFDGWSGNINIKYNF